LAPNPFNPVTTINYGAKEKSHVLLQVFDTLGREAATLVDAEQAQGEYQVRFGARRYPSGLYFYRIQVKDFFAVKKMVFI
jgi:hypothetical protein